MKENILQDIIKRFDWFVKDVDFNNLPERDSEEYRKLMMQTADVMFSEGRYSAPTEYCLEVFEIPGYEKESRSLAAINALTDEERRRFGFYMDLKEMCHPLFRSKKIDWSAWPWNMENGESSFDNKELFDFIVKYELPNLSAVILHDLHELMTRDAETYTSVARNEISHTFYYGVEFIWGKGDKKKSDEAVKELMSAVEKCADDLWEVENHMKIGRLMGLDKLEMEIYDAMDTFIDSIFRYKQVLMAKELAAWIRENFHASGHKLTQEEFQPLWMAINDIMSKYSINSPDINYTVNIIVIDVLGIPIFDESDMEDEDWDDIDSDND